MTFKKSLKTRKAQSSVEYVVLFAIIASLTLLGITTFLPRLRKALGETEEGKVVEGSFFDKAMNQIH